MSGGNPGFGDAIQIEGGTDGTIIGNDGDRLKIGIFDPETGTPSLVTPAGALKISEIVHLCGDVFGTGPLSDKKWDINEINSATETEINGELIMATNGAVDADARIQSKTRARFYPGHFNTAHVAAQLSSVWATADTVAEWGAYDADDPVNGDGIFIRYTDGEFSIVTKRSGVENVVNEGSFTGFIPAKNANTNVYEIAFNAGTARFIQGVKVFHVESAASGPYVGTPHLRAGARIYNKNGHNGNHDIRFRALGIYRVGRPYAVPDYEYISAAGATTIKTSPGTLHRIVLTRQGGGASTETVTFHDGSTTADPVFAEIAMATNDNQSHSFEHIFNNGLTVDISSSQFNLTVIYD